MLASDPGNPLRGQIVCPFRDPGTSLQCLLNQWTNGAFARGEARFHVVEQAPAQVQGYQMGAYVHYRSEGQNQRFEGLALILMGRLDQGSWMLYSSLVSSPAEIWAEDFPSMWEMWKSWSVNPAVYRERMDAALQSMREMYDIIRATHDNTQRTYDNTNKAWSQTIRGVTEVEDTVTRGRGEFDTNTVDQLVNALNRDEGGYRYRIVPIDQLVRR